MPDRKIQKKGSPAWYLRKTKPLHPRLQQEINSGRFRYRIKRGEHPDWNQERVIENELAARILLAFDVKQPWSCHQTYKLFDELHSDIFGRPEVDGARVTTIYNVYRLVIGKLDLLENQLFARYTITRFLVLYLLREALEKDPQGKEFCLRPA